jgi:hypothetical protein
MSLRVQAISRFVLSNRGVMYHIFKLFHWLMSHLMISVHFVWFGINIIINEMR